MKRTPVLCGHHVGRMIRKHWYVKGKVKVIQTGAEDVVRSNGFEVVDYKEFLFQQKPKERPPFVGLYTKELPLDENHPDYKVTPCYKYLDDNLLLEGMDQAKVLTNTVERAGLPEKINAACNNLKLPDLIHSEIKKRLKLCCIFEATQQKLPKRKDPERPAWVFPRDYGITDIRKNELLCKNLATVSDQYINDRNKSIVNNMLFCTPFEAHNKRLQFEMTSEVVVTTTRKLKALEDPNVTHKENLPNIHPVDCTVSLVPFNFYEMKNIYPFSVKSKYPHVQTAFLSYNETVVKNLFEEKATESQIESRSLMKGFLVAAAQARALYGDDVVDLPEPVVVPVIQTNGQLFHFTVFQLNTLAIDKKSDTKNIFWHSPRIPMYETCNYVSAIPTLEGYNPEVINKIVTFMSVE